MIFDTRTQGVAALTALISAMTRILLTTTSFQDTPGSHHQLLEMANLEVITARGPLSESAILSLVGEVDGLLCGDDAITAAVLDRALPRLRVISKYGIGLDKIDMAAATARQIPVLFTPGVNHTTVAEHTFALLLALVRHLVPSVNATAAGQWKRLTGHEIMGKTLGVFGLGRIGKEVALRGRAFGLRILAYDLYWDEAFATANGIERCASPNDLFKEADILSLHCNLSPETRHLINGNTLAIMKPGVIILNCARGELVDNTAIAEAMKSGIMAGYGADVLDEEPPSPNHPLLRLPNCLITPHIGSRTYESVLRQATMAAQNLILALKGQKPLAQANNVPIPAAR